MPFSKQPSSLRSKWCSLKSRFSADPLTISTKRRTSDCSCCSNQSSTSSASTYLPTPTDSPQTEHSHTHKRKLSDSLTLMSDHSTKAERLFSSIPNLFRRPNSLPPSPTLDIAKETAGVNELYAYALDEINYARDSVGSPYYPGDLETTREAIDNYNRAFDTLVQQTTDMWFRNYIESQLRPRLDYLERTYNSLPDSINEEDSIEPSYSYYTTAIDLY
ncbi:hypothetical protein J3Q64DRAFT_1739420 [Phycomyces blakesleeanus]|uniref:Uncharacterized protein n=2 Tax=Phycomyces blakesleeanus TaxID=4837 RepID=A0A167NAH8_PHYB8|nr:hypothetical protein PHYBLDRAFT_166735 [Phycomyces blakesleeanus NRRL 1555(-)]OAD75494.1 hypothetical protein PHYBLDRAFT_166735 [Phycomyces blakesleeanus NRRL 1555(-)]|eukprot:XP_018293534.1 hypothetical protein PHYBLDRAFT_166735 [Phycomyces blakesleeanus NRRL 1555(-)]